jgi:hypothetical protein
MLLPGEKLTFFWDIKDTALFYTDRKATLLYTEKQLLDYLSSGRTALCVIARQDYERFPQVVAASTVVDREGNKLLIAPRPHAASGDARPAPGRNGSE